MKLSFSTLGCADRELDEIISLAKRFNISGIEFRGVGGIMNNADIECFKPENAAKTQESLANASLRAITLGSSCSFHDGKRTASTLKEFKESAEVAARMQIPYIRVFGNNITEDKDSCFERVASGICKACDIAEPFGITVLLEVHGDFVTVEAISEIIKRINVNKHSNFGLIWDIAHSHKIYRKNWEEFYSSIKPYIRHVHIKDLRDSDGKLTQIGEGDIPIKDIIHKMLSDGYDGYFSLEWEKKWHPELSDIEPALEAFVKLASEA